jgi:hypothetical protein
MEVVGVKSAGEDEAVLHVLRLGGIILVIVVPVVHNGASMVPSWQLECGTVPGHAWRTEVQS